MFERVLFPLCFLASLCYSATPRYDHLVYGLVGQRAWDSQANSFRYTSKTAQGPQSYEVDLSTGTKKWTKKASGPARPAAKPAPAVAGNVFVRGSQVFLKKGDKEIQLSADGNPTDTYLNRIIYSPDKRYAVVLKQRQLVPRELNIVESSPTDQLHTKMIKKVYVKPGDEVAATYPMLFDLEKAQPVPIDFSPLGHAYEITRVRWDDDGKHFTFEYNERGHQSYQLWSVEAASGAMRLMIDESSPTFIYYNELWRQHLKDQKGILWLSERDGWKHLYLYDTTKPQTIKKQLTKGEWIVRKVLFVDEQKSKIYFLAGGYYPEENPYYCHLFSVNIDGTGLCDLTPAKGNHNIELSPDYKYFIDTLSTPEQAPVTSLHKLADGSLIAQLEQADASAAVAAGWTWPKTFCAKGRDGKTDIYGNIYFPPNFDPHKKYPVLEQIYAGPHDSHVNHHFHLFHNISRTFTHEGYIVLSIDGMGTYNRSKAFHDVCWKNLKDAGFPDRIAWIKKAAEQYPSMDLSRMGVYGMSAGGQNAMGALVFHNDFYKAAIASCGCHDNRVAKVWWSEQWMGYPIEQHYLESSNVVNAHLLKGRLMLMVGELDTNVDPAITMKAVDALVRANKFFEMLVVPRGEHSFGGVYGVDRMVEFFERNLKTQPKALKGFTN